VDYWSESNQCWLPAIVICIDADTGDVRVNVKPDRNLNLDAQGCKLRPRTKPTRTQLEWMRSVLREGRIEQEALALFKRFAWRSHVDDPELVLFSNSMHDVGAAIDAQMGVTGMVARLKDYFKKNCTERLTAEVFTEFFWELMWDAQQEHCTVIKCNSTARQDTNPHGAYDIGMQLGRGTFGSVCKATLKGTNITRAVKIMCKAASDNMKQVIDNEIDHLITLDHPHIVKLYEYYEDATSFYLVMDFCSGGDLADRIKQHRRTGLMIGEVFIAKVISQVLKGICHVHARGVVHLDLKPANIMIMPCKSTLPPSRNSSGCTMATDDEQPHAMIIDLGVSQFFRPGRCYGNEPFGTPTTMAPEIWRGVITPKADVFSLGVTCFELLCLRLPFYSPSNIAEANLYWSTYPDAPWHFVETAPKLSRSATRMCRRMLNLDRHSRPTAQQCLKCAFISSLGQTTAEEPLPLIPQDYIDHLLDMPKRGVLHKSVALSIAQSWPANQLPTIARIFWELDVEGTGRLRCQDIAAALERLGAESVRACQASDAMDLSRDGTVSWTEFIAACINLASDGLEQDLLNVFNGADADGEGLLDTEALARLLATDHLRGDAVRDIFRELTRRSEDGTRIDWPTFLQHFRPNAGHSEYSEVLHPAGQVNTIEVPPPRSDAVAAEAGMAAPPHSRNIENAVEGVGEAVREIVPVGGPSGLLDQVCELVDRARNMFVQEGKHHAAN